MLDDLVILSSNINFFLLFFVKRKQNEKNLKKKALGNSAAHANS